MTTIDRILRHPWRVVRTMVGQASMIVLVRCSHRTRRGANLCAFTHDAAELILTGFRPQWRHDVRHRGVRR